MKNIFLLSGLLLSFVRFSIAQDFAPVGSQWYYDSMDSGQAPPHSEYFLYRSEKDTTVNNTSCKKISINKFGFDGNIYLYPPLFVYGDTNEVFYFNYQFEKFCSLYKFNVSIGDTLDFYTLPSAFVSDSIFKVRVDTIFFEAISNRTVKFIYTESLPTFNGYSFSFWGAYCQYIGGLNLMLPQQIPNIPEMDGPLRCYSDSDTAFSFNNNWPLSCNFIITGETTPGNSFNLFYDFNKNLLHIQAESPGQVSVHITDVLGSVIYTNDFRANDLRQVDLNYLQPGIYFIRVFSPKNSLSYFEKIIKM
ncbi:MAG TPA: T9SS type A sorting domain-containing protein [Chitinophagales bacterium]|nr:T9SS type A sorting domain-containing protein [Chitinophagales bacterium]